MKDYTILSAENQADLCEFVRAAMAKGWQPLGGVGACVVEVGDDAIWEYNQAMTK